MSALTEFQKERCPSHLLCENWKICSKCSNGRIVEAMIGSNSTCTLAPTKPTVLTIIGRNKTEVLEAFPEIEDMMRHGYMRGEVRSVFWNRDEDTPDYFTYDYDKEV